MGTAWTRRGQIILGRMACWYIHALNFPGRPYLSTDFNQPSNSVQVDGIDVVSLRELSKTLPKFLTGLSEMVGVAVPVMLQRNLSTTFPFLSNMT